MSARRTAALLLIALVLSVQAATAATSQPAKADAVSRLISTVNGHRLAATAKLFAASATLRVANHTWHGRPAIERWWRGQFTRRVHLSLRSRIQVKGNDAQAVVWRTTQGGDCPKGCLERGVWRVSGTLVQQMTLSPLPVPTPPAPVPVPPATLPPPPSAPPPPNVTPTIPT